MKGKSALMLSVVVFFAASIASPAQEDAAGEQQDVARRQLVSAFDEIVDFSMTLEDLHTLARERSSGSSASSNGSNGTSSDSQARTNVNIDEFPLLLIDGYIASTVVHQDSEEAFSATIELVDGEWEGLDEVHAYRARLLAEGDAFRERIPSRPPSSPGDDEILAGRRGIALARLQEFRTDPVTGNAIAVLETLRFRITR
ncbi:MAG: hypothetical protein ACOCRN_02060 [Spirochaetia bacterium]